MLSLLKPRTLLVVHARKLLWIHHHDHGLTPFISRVGMGPVETLAYGYSLELLCRIAWKSKPMRDRKAISSTDCETGFPSRQTTAVF